MQSYIHTDQWLHLLSQVLAKVNRTYVQPVPDDSHTNMGLGQTTLNGRWINSTRGNNYLLRITLGQSAPRLQLIDQFQGVLFEYDIVGKSQAALESTIQSDLVSLGFEDSGTFDALHFEITNYHFANEPIPAKLDLHRWLNLRTQANRSCTNLLNELAVPGEPRIWPHHFDTGAYTELDGTLGLGFGLAMADTLIDKPYYYLAGYPLNDWAVDYTEMEDHAGWLVTQSFKGAVLPLITTNSPDAARIDAFLKKSALMLLEQARANR